jgi:hypothetical protein
MIGLTRVAVVLCFAALGFAAFASATASRGHHSAVATGPWPTKAQRQAVGALATFVDERGSYWAGGEVSGCNANWHPPLDVVAQLLCTAFGRFTVYTRFRTSRQASRYFSELASEGGQGTATGGRCKRWLLRWSRSIFAPDETESGSVVFRRLGARALIIWSWPDVQTIAQAGGSVADMSQLCQAGI